MKQFLMLSFACLLAVPAMAADPDTRLFEMRTYYAAPGKLEDLKTRFRDHTMKLFAAHGITNVAYWTPVDNADNKLIYVLAYPSREARETSWKEFMADPEWKAASKASEANGRLVTKVDSVYMKAADYSPMVQPTSSSAPRLFELRTYHAAPGMMDALHTRFREHTLQLFAKHGMANFGYWTPTEKKNGAGETLIYIVAHKDKAAADASWKAFRADPDWVKVKKDSEVNGSLTLPDGVKSEFMVPTDFSPTK